MHTQSSLNSRHLDFKMKPWIIVAILLGLLTISLAIITSFLFNEVLNLKKDDEIKYLNQDIQNMKATHQQIVVEGCGYRTPDGFCTATVGKNRQADINTNFVDGISLTYQ